MYVVFEVLKVPKRWSFLAIGVIYLVYAFYFAKQRKDSWHEMGFRIDNILAGLIPIALCTIVVGGGLIAFAIMNHRVVWGRDEVLVLLALYPVWALVQQFAFQGLLHRGLMELIGSPVIQVLITAVAFGCVHFGNITLVGLTFAAGVLWSVLYRRWPNLWLLAASHTILAALAYPLVLGDAPLLRL